MSLNNGHIDELIGKYLAGEAARDEVHIVETWANESDGNRKYFDHCKLIFDRSTSVKDLQRFDADAAWAKFKSRMNSTGVRTIGGNEKKSDRDYYWMAAASVIVLLGIGFILYRMSAPAVAPQFEVAAGTTTKTDTLPDGSEVFLNKRTELTYTYDNDKKNHVVKLRGEAYFNIQHEENKTFIVDVAGVFIKDIGTAFNVKAYPDSTNIEVIVEEGSVMFYTDTDSGVYLSANGKGIYNKLTKKFSVDKPGENATSYKTKFFSFSDTDLESVIAALNNVYHKQIVIDRNLYNCHLTVSFNNENIDEIAAVIAETLGLTVTSSANEIRLEGPGCGN
jgi:ferric-dicitrate binding protein FerR (iron transport regulator)